jgi:pyruvate ferredoxin oxidoreductase delta subunit
MKFTTEFEYSWAHGDKLFLLNTGEWRFQKPMMEFRKCSKCGKCYFFCPAGSIKDMGTHFGVDLQYCKGCGICATLCPRSAIQMVREV